MLKNCVRAFWVLSVFLVGCSSAWQEGPYQVYWTGNTQALGYSLGGGSFISRVDQPKTIASNANYISVYACPGESCAFYYIDKQNDHKFAEHNEFVFGPFTIKEFLNLVEELGLPEVGIEE